MTAVRRVACALASLGAAWSLVHASNHYTPWMLYLPIGLLVLAGGLQLGRGVGAQLFVRAVWWSNLLLGALIATSGSGSERTMGGELALGCGVALLALGRRGLDESERFAPIAFRSTLMAMLVMAMADAQSLVLFGGLELAEPRYLHDQIFSSVAALAIAALLAVASLGVYRLKLWGVALNLAANVALGACALTGFFELPRPLLVAYTVTAALQIVIALPLWLALARGGGAQKPRSRLAVALSATTIVALIAVACTCAFVLDRPIWSVH